VNARAHRLSDLVTGLADTPSFRDAQITALTADSRAAGSGCLFLAWPGGRADGRSFVNDAVARGAAAVAYEPDGVNRADFERLPVPAVAVRNLAWQAGAIADRFYGSPSRPMFVVGITGTNGKTTCAYLAAQALDGQLPVGEPVAGQLSAGHSSAAAAGANAAGGRCALIGTLGYGFADELATASHTTPDALSVQRLLRDFLDRGASSVCMEVSSHALDQGRVHGVRFDCAVFTNLSRDHLDYHITLDAYAEAKQRLFEFEGLRTAVINRDDETGRRLLARVGGGVTPMSYGFDGGDVFVRDMALGPDGIHLRVGTPAGDAEIASPLIGRFNVANLLAVLAVLLAAGMPLATAAQRLSRAHAPAGRMERFGGKARPLVVVDYAHTPDALDKVLAAAREHATGSVYCVFGCGGDRDRGKRPLMGEIAERAADVVILTDDNPRNEDGDAIISDIASGMRARPAIVRDRARAIATAVAAARAGDIVLVAGKGHEDYQQVGDERRPFSDREVVRQLMREAA
jgi:UDP-N-acetylmuramoyl-L-alanyl-D-glutamate--2,6-diaminopimelate ligase